jgi:hypothetical protein
MHPSSSVRLRFAMALAALLSLLPLTGLAATKIKVAAIGDGAPGGGQFLGPALTGSPSSAGNGWVTFRTLVTAGSATEQIVAANLVPGAVGQDSSTYVVASIGQSAGKDHDLDLGSFKGFLGRPTVNANGDVAFVATLSNSARLAADPTAPVPAGVFLYKRTVAAGASHLLAIALSRTDYGAGTLDFGQTIDIIDSTSLTATDIPERTPGLNDAGDVAFAAATTAGNSSTAGAIFVAPFGNAPAVAVRLGDVFGDDLFAVLGPPVLTNGGRLVYRALLSRNLTDGVYTTSGGTTTALVQSGYQVVTSLPSPLVQTLFDFDETVSANDAGDVVFSAGPLFDSSLTSNDVNGAPGVFVIHGGTVTMLAYPGDPVPAHGRITNIQLGAEGGNKTAPPVLTPDGTVVFLGELNGGQERGLFRLSPPYQTNVIIPFVIFGGKTPSASPIGGTYSAASSAPAVDANGDASLYTRLSGATSSEALVFLPATGLAQSIVVGNATPSGALLGGPPFSTPIATDGGDVYFKSYMASGPSALGIFRWKAADPKDPLEVLVRTGDVTPLAGNPKISDIAGDPSVNERGDVAFTGIVDGVGRVVFLRDGNGLHKIAAPGDVVPTPPAPKDAAFDSVAAGPLVLADGSVVFHGTFDYPDPLIPFQLDTQDTVLLADPSGALHVIARVGDAAPDGAAYFRFHDEFAAGGPMFAFRASLGNGADLTAPLGIFLVSPTAVSTIAVENEALGNGLGLGALVGRAGMDAAGDIAFLGKLSGSADNSTLVRRAVDGTISLVSSVGGPGPDGNGTVKSLGRPAVSSNGHVAFRAGFVSLTGGIAGFFLSTDAGNRSFVQVGESDDDGQGGRLTSINPSGSLNASDHLAFISSVSGGKARNGIFLAAPTEMSAQAVGGMLRDPAANGTSRDLLRGRFFLRPGDIGDGFRLTRDAVILSLSDATAPYFTANVPKNGLVKRGGVWVPKKKHRAKPLQSLQIRLTKGGVRVSFSAGGLDLFGLTPPLTFRLDVGNDSGSVTVPCTISPAGRIDCNVGSASSRRRRGA